MILTSQVMELQTALMAMEEYLSQSYIKTMSYRILSESAVMYILRTEHPYTFDDIGSVFGMLRQQIYKRLKRYEIVREQYPQHAEYLENLSRDIIRDVHNNQRKRLN